MADLNKTQAWNFKRFWETLNVTGSDVNLIIVFKLYNIFTLQEVREQELAVLQEKYQKLQRR